MQQRVEDCDLVLQQQSCCRWQQVRQTLRRSMRTVCRPECVIHVDLAVCRELLRECRVVLFFSAVKSNVLQYGDIARLELLNYGRDRGANAVGGKTHRQTHEL